MSETDIKLLARYNREQVEAAFAEIVRRHVALVYSAALRQVRSPQLAEEVSQSVFTDLARNAARLKSDTVLSAWLYQVTRRTAIDVVRREASRQLREQVALELNAMNATAQDWTHIEPLLDEAMQALDNTDRAAVLLRYFENKSLREVGDAIGASENAAQKRLTRAVERLREFFNKRGVTVGAGGVVVAISTNAVQAAPAGLAVTISSAAALAGTTAATTVVATATTTKAVAMTTLQKAIVGATLAAFVGIGLSHKFHTTPIVATSDAIPAIDSDAPKAPRLVIPETQPGQFAAATTPIENVQPSLTPRQLYERALVHERAQRYDEALADLTKSLELLEQGIGRWEWSPTPGAPTRDHRFDSLVAAYFSRSGLFRYKKNFASAVADLDRLLEFAPKYYSARFNRAQYLKHLNQKDAAIAEFSVIIEDPDIDFSSQLAGKEKCFAATYQNRGWVQQDKKEYEKAVVDFTDSLRLDPSGGDTMIVYWHRGLCYQALQRVDKALEDANSLSQWALEWATGADSKDSDRDKALTAARFGSEIFKHQLPYQLEVLAAVKAKAGDFTEAVHEQQRAMLLLTAATEDQPPAMQARLDLYKTGKPLVRKP